MRSHGKITPSLQSTNWPFCLAAIIASASSWGCAPETPGVASATAHVSDLQHVANSDIVLRDIVRVDDQTRSWNSGKRAFGHAARKWHAYSFAMPGNVGVRATLHTHGPATFDQAALRLIGPLPEDGSWPEHAVGATAVDGTAQLLIQPLEAGRYLLLAGPKHGDHFAPRFASELGHGTWSDEAHAREQRFGYDDDGAYFTRGETQYRVVAPTPDEVGANQPGTIFTLSGPDGELHWTLSSWLRRHRLMSLRSHPADAPVVTVDLAEGTVANEDFERLLVHAVLSGPGAEATPMAALLAPTALGGRALEVVPSASCPVEMLCNDLIHADDHTLVAPAVVDAVSEPFGMLPGDESEPSQYDIELVMEGNLPPPSPPASSTRYPIYYAHGFNDKAATWQPLLKAVLKDRPAMQGWVTAASVPPDQPISPRAEQLRRNLHKFLLRAQSEQLPTGENFLRVNIVAHSMGGLDSRFLVGEARYNEDCDHWNCFGTTNDSGDCCAPPDLDGQPTTWRQRVASITTLSTPHCGSSFADFTLALMDDGKVGSSIKLVAKNVFGFDSITEPNFRKTLEALSIAHCTEYTSTKLPVPDPQRKYDWGCVVSGQCSPPPQDDRPVYLGAGAYGLPAPKAGNSTIFSWAGQSCMNGSCGDVLGAKLWTTYKIVKDVEGANDGVVSTKSSRFGIKMGIKAYDHSDWMRFDDDGSAQQFSEWWHEQGRPPSVRFHLNWVQRLRVAGY